MNERFYLLPAEKQRRIINAAYKVFAENSYKKAPMAEIAGAGHISKALLFHYFGSKKELYLYLWRSSLEATRRAMRENHVTETEDFFEMIRRSLAARCALMRTHPYLYLFSLKAYYEQEPDIKAMVQGSYQKELEHSGAVIWSKVELAGFRPDVDVRLLYQEILWISDGYIRQMLSAGAIDTFQMEEDFMRMIEQWRKAYLK